MRELTPRRPEGVRRQDSRNLGPTLWPIPVRRRRRQQYPPQEITSGGGGSDRDRERWAISTCSIIGARGRAGRARAPGQFPNSRTTAQDQDGLIEFHSSPSLLPLHVYLLLFCPFPSLFSISNALRPAKRPIAQCSPVTPPPPPLVLLLRD